MVRMLLSEVVAQLDDGYRFNGCIYIKVCAVAVWSIYTDNLFMRDMPKDIESILMVRQHLCLIVVTCFPERIVVRNDYLLKFLCSGRRDVEFLRIVFKDSFKVFSCFLRAHKELVDGMLSVVRIAAHVVEDVKNDFPETVTFPCERIGDEHLLPAFEGMWS